MIDFTLDAENSLLHVRPSGRLTEKDFQDVAAAVDPYIEANGRLQGLLLEIDQFPGWETIGAAMEHFRFARDHHTKIHRLAVVTDSPVGTFGEHVADHFVDAEIRHFPGDHLGEAKQWLKQDRPDAAR